MSINHSNQGVRKARRIGLTLGLILLLLIVQACGNNNSNSNSNASSPAPSSFTAEPSGSPSESAQAPSANAPAVLNYGFVGSKSPTGTEGWGFHTGIIQDELKKYGITDVQLVPFLTGPDLNESVIGGRVDIGNSGDTPAILAHSSGAKTRILNLTSAKVNTLLIGRKDGIKSADELKGKTIAVVKGSLMYRFVVGFLEEKGLTKDVKVININSLPDSEAALARGEIDAYATTGSSYSAYKLIQDGYPLLAEANQFPSLLSTSIVYATEDYLSKFADFPKVWNEARQKAYEDLKAKPDEYYQWASEQTGTPADVIKTLQPIELLAPEALPAEGIDRIKAAKDFLVAQKLAKNDFNVDEWILK